MNVKYKKLHIGQKIKEVLVSSKIKQTEFAEMLGKQQGNLSKIFKSETIKTDELIAISEILNHNFFADFFEIEEEILNKTEDKTDLPDNFMTKYDQMVIKTYELEKENAEMTQVIDSLENRLSKYEKVKKEGAL